MTRLLIAAHGGSGGRATDALNALAGDVAALLHGWRVAVAELSVERSLDAAVAALDARDATDLRVLPHFMSDGWFASVELPRRLDAADVHRAAMLPPFGCLDGIATHCSAVAAQCVGDEGPDTPVVLAAHGSTKDPRPAAAARAVAAAMDGPVSVGFVDQAPALADALRAAGAGCVVPFFAAPGGHVLDDIPAACRAAGFTSPVAPPVGSAPGAAALIARAVRSGPA